MRGEVIDEGGGFEHEIRARGPEDIKGRGLFLVDALTDRWGIHEGTTHVWFELVARTDASAQTALAAPADADPPERGSVSAIGRFTCSSDQ